MKQHIGQKCQVVRTGFKPVTLGCGSQQNRWLDSATHRVYAADKSLHIGPTEFRLLHFLMTHPDRVYSRAQLLDQVWGDHEFLEECTVDVHIRRLRLALQPSGHDNLIKTVRGSGYLLFGRSI